MSLRPSQGPAHLKGSFEKLAVIVVNLANMVQAIGQEMVDRKKTYPEEKGKGTTIAEEDSIESNLI